MIPRPTRLAPRAHLVLATVAISTLLPTTSAVAASADHPSTGGGTAGPAYVLPRSLVAEAADHARIAGSVRTQLDAGRGTPSRPVVVTLPRSRTINAGPGARCPREEPHCLVPTAQHLKVDNRREGAGNPCRPSTTGCSRLGRKFYTCAAAAVRNMTSTLTGRDRGELHFEQALRISTSQGLLGIAHIPRVLNAEYATYPAWTVVRPRSAADYLAQVVTDVRVFGRAVVQNVHTAPLWFFGDAELTHYDLAYGYDTRGKNVRIAEEWDPRWTFGLLPRAYRGHNPRGLYDVSAKVAFKAVSSSPNRAVVV